MNYKEINKRLDMHAVVSWLGLKETHSGFICCPVHDDHHASMKVYSHNVFCFACSSHFDSIGLTAEIKGLSQRQACKVLCETFFLPFEYTSHSSQKPKQKQDCVAERISLWCESVIRGLTIYVREMAGHGIFCEWAEAVLDNGFAMTDDEFYNTYSGDWRLMIWEETWAKYRLGQQ